MKNLTEACRGLCNYFPEDKNIRERSFFPCEIKDQGATKCIPVAERRDGTYNCNNRADEDPFHSGEDYRVFQKEC